MASFQYNPEDFETQLTKVFKAFSEYPSTMLMVASRTGVIRTNITWHVDMMKDQGRIFLIKSAPCLVSPSGSNAAYYSTDTKFRGYDPPIDQIEIPFDD